MYVDIKGLAAHIQKQHSNDFEAEPQTRNPSKDCECPYCSNVYSRRDKLSEHIRKIHPGREVPKLERSPKVKAPPVEDEDSNHSQESSADSVTSASGFGAGKIYITPVKGRGKYKQKEFTCPICNKGYCDATRLKDHIETRHEQKNDPWRNVGPNTDIAIRNRQVKSGFEVYKVLGLYSTGLRMKAARFAHVSADKWILTEEVNKSVMKHDIIAILTTLSKQENGAFQLDLEELEKVQSLISNTKLRTSTVVEQDNDQDNEDEDEVENLDEDNDEDLETVESYDAENYTENEAGEVLVQPVFENGEVQVFTNADYQMEVDS